LDPSSLILRNAARSSQLHNVEICKEISERLTSANGAAMVDAVALGMGRAGGRLLNQHSRINSDNSIR
jgi:hypothetical protein